MGEPPGPHLRRDVLSQLLPKGGRDRAAHQHPPGVMRLRCLYPTTSRNFTSHPRDVPALTALRRRVRLSHAASCRTEQSTWADASP
jgi:hypothetical protein